MNKWMKVRQRLVQYLWFTVFLFFFFFPSSLRSRLWLFNFQQSRLTPPHWLTPLCCNISVQSTTAELFTLSKNSTFWVDTQNSLIPGCLDGERFHLYQATKKRSGCTKLVWKHCIKNVVAQDLLALWFFFPSFTHWRCLRQGWHLEFGHFVVSVIEFVPCTVKLLSNWVILRKLSFWCFIERYRHHHTNGIFSALLRIRVVMIIV